MCSLHPHSKTKGKLPSETSLPAIEIRGKKICVSTVANLPCISSVCTNAHNELEWHPVFCLHCTSANDRKLCSGLHVNESKKEAWLRALVRMRG